MSCLLYCLFRLSPSSTLLTDLPKGIDQGTVLVDSYRDLYGAYSNCLPEPEQQKSNQDTIDRLITFGQVADTLHQCYTVIPMRYGCWFDNSQLLVQHLNTHYQEYDTSLKALDHLTEMGVKVILPAPSSIVQNDQSDTSAKEWSKGVSYLMARRRCYNENINNADVETTVEQINENFQGLYSQCQWEVNTHADQRVLSMYYLVSKSLIDSFKTAFQCLLVASNNNKKLLISGPWPPYNFLSENKSVTV